MVWLVLILTYVGVGILVSRMRKVQAGFAPECPGDWVPVAFAWPLVLCILAAEFLEERRR